MGVPIVISVLGDTRDLVRSLGQAESRTGKFGRVMGGMGRLAGAGLAAAGVAGVAFAASAIKSASNAQQSYGATETVFGKFAQSVIRNSDKAAQSVGLSANEYRESANLIGSLFKNQGVASDQLAGKTDAMVKTGADLAATFGGKTSEAVAALGSAFKGEFDPLERYGISLKQSTINAELAARGEDKLTGAALAAAKQRATTRLITKQAGDSLGAFGRESNTLAGQQQRLGASWENIKAKAGSAMLPALTSVAAAVNEKVLPGLAKLGGPTKALAADFGGRLQGAFKAVSPVLQTMATTFTTTILPALQRLGAYLVSTFTPVFKAVAGVIRQVLPIVGQLAQYFYGTLYPAVVRIITAVGVQLRPVFDAIATAITTQVVPAISALLVRFQAALPTIQRVISVVVRVAGAVLTFAAAILGRVLPVVIRLAAFLIGRVVRAIGVTISVIARIVGAVMRFGSALASGVSSVVRFAGRVISLVASIPGRVLRAIGNAASHLVGKGRDFITGLIRGVGDKFGAMATKVRDVISRAKGALSGAGSALAASGRALIQGLITGIGEKIGEAIQKVRDGLQKIKNMLPGSPIKEGPLKSWNNGGAGKRLMVMLASGLRETRPVEEAMAAAAGKIALVPPSVSRSAIRPSLAMTQGGLQAGGNTYVDVRLEVPVGANAVDIGRELQAFLDEYASVGGRRR